MRKAGNPIYNTSDCIAGDFFPFEAICIQLCCYNLFPAKYQTRYLSLTVYCHIAAEAGRCQDNPSAVADKNISRSKNPAAVSAEPLHYLKISSPVYNPSYQ